MVIVTNSSTQPDHHDVYQVGPWFVDVRPCLYTFFIHMSIHIFYTHVYTHFLYTCLYTFFIHMSIHLSIHMSDA